MTTKMTSQPVELTARRAAAYMLLSRCLAYPDARGIELLQEAGVASSDLLKGGPLEEVARRASEGADADIADEHVRLFSISFSPDCPTFETAFVSTDATDQTMRMADVAGFYRAFGVDTSETGFRPDDICVELEFMAFMCQKQMYAAEHLGAPRVAQSLKAQRSFLKDHLGRWAGALGRRLVLRARPGSFYAEVGCGLEDWMAEDLRALGVEDVDLIEKPATNWPKPEEDEDAPVEPAIIGLDEIGVR
ncbi:MAG TPA: molecular chaperone TorD family protein [Tepidiformaceae bacterium]